MMDEIKMTFEEADSIIDLLLQQVDTKSSIEIKTNIEKAFVLDALNLMREKIENEKNRHIARLRWEAIEEKSKKEELKL